jgi:hypothetical protein
MERQIAGQRREQQGEEKCDVVGFHGSDPWIGVII